MPPKSAETSTKKFLKLEVVGMIFENSIVFSLPKQGEIKNAIQTMRNNPQDLSDREVWILKEFVREGF